jgi:hypothetical protein
VARYPLAERAEGYLLAMAGGTDPHTDPLADDLEPAPIALGPGDDPAPVRRHGRRRRPPADPAAAPLPFPD